MGWDVLEDPTEIVEPHRRVKPLCHRRGLETGRLTSSRERVVQVCESQRGAESASAGRLQRPNVVYPAVGVKVERDTRDDVLTTMASDKHMKGGGVEAAE